MEIINNKCYRYNEASKLKWEKGEFPYQSIADHKFSLLLHDGNIIEAGVFELIVEGKHEKHICLSTQAGCKFGCAMCSSGKRGFARNLLAEEISEEISLLARELGIKAFDQVIFMGIGEPLDNYDEFLRAISMIIADESDYAGRISFASVGLPAKMEALARDMKKKSLPPFRMIWLSLHAPCQEKRNSIMPVSQLYKLSDVLESFRNYSRKQPHTKMWVNYLVFKGFNDQEDDSKMLAELLNGTEGELSVMVSEPNNDLPGYRMGDNDDIYRFKKYLINEGVKNEISCFSAAGKKVSAGCGEFIFRPLN